MNALDAALLQKIIVDVQPDGVYWASRRVLPHDRSGAWRRLYRKVYALAIQFNHLLIFARDKRESAQFLTQLFGLPDPQPAGFFLAVDLANDVTLHYGEPSVEFLSQHYAFLVSDDEFDAIFARMQERGMTYWADPRQQYPGQINTNHGGRGVYFLDPSGHGLEIITRPYGSDAS